MSVIALQEAMKKMANETHLPDNENQTTVGVMNVYPNVEEGQKEPPDPMAHSKAVEREGHEDRSKMLNRVFDGMPQAKTQAQAEVAQVLEGPYESRSPLLQKSAGFAPEHQSLTDRVRKVIGQ
jgi:hypothetical protein